MVSNLNTISSISWHIAIAVHMLELVATTSELEVSLASRPLSSGTEKETPCTIESTRGVPGSTTYGFC